MSNCQRETASLRSSLARAKPMQIPAWDAPARQISYYFSDANFARDGFLRSLRRPETRFVPLRELARFPKLARLSKAPAAAASNVDEAEPALEPFLAALVEARCPELELSPERDAVRRQVPFPDDAATDAVKRVVQQQQRRGIDAESRARTVFVGGLDDRTTDADLHELFSQVALVQSVRLPESEDGRRRGFAFVELASDCSVLYACLALNGLVLHGRALRLQPSGSDDSTTQARTLRVSNVDEDVNEVTLYEAFSEIAEVWSVRLLRDNCAPSGCRGGNAAFFGRSRGSGTVTFVTERGAAQALEYGKSGRAVLFGRLLHLERAVSSR